VSAIRRHRQTGGYHETVSDEELDKAKMAIMGGIKREHY